MAKTNTNKQLTTQETIERLRELLKRQENIRIIEINQDFSKTISEYLGRNIPVGEEILSQPFTI
jgi:recombination DNA repair RAD52 pathway protein